MNHRCNTIKIFVLLWSGADGDVKVKALPKEKSCYQFHQEQRAMPYVNIKITREGATATQKAQLIAGVTKLLQEVLGKNPATTVVVIDEVETDNWGIGGESVTVRRQRES
jgi:4-oxalocrotonate tautomerase